MWQKHPGKFRNLLAEHLKDVVIVALYPHRFAVGKLFDACVLPPPVAHETSF
jgi:hypothetical protein